MIRSLRIALDRQFRAMPFTSSLIALTAIVGVHALAGFHAGLNALYVIPIWFATRVGGLKCGAAIAALAVAFGVYVESFILRQLPTDRYWAELLIRMLSTGAVLLLIAHVEGSLTRQQVLAMRDPLTGLLNRRALMEVARDLFQRVAPEREPVVVAMIDCNNFKTLNDTYGHKAGDEVLRMLARTLEQSTRASDLVARVGGDEFVVVLHNVLPDDAQMIFTRIETSFERAAMAAGFPCTVSIGYAPMEDTDQSLEVLIRAADAAMYTSKGQRKGAVYAV